MPMETLLGYLLDTINVGLGLMTLGVFTAASFPALDSYLKYGKTLQPKKIYHKLHLPLDIHNIYVPKRWFTHFYIIHFVLSLVNGVILYINYTLFADIHIICTFNLIQSSRRLYECLYVSKLSPIAKIHIFHYLVGLIFYTSIDVIPLLMYILNRSTQLHPISTILSVLVFTLASIDQWMNHNTLSKQVKYTLPQSGLFKYVVCPHYFDESLIYLSMFILKPSISFSVVFAWVFINLSISAKQSYIFYKDRKDVDISNRHVIVPFIY